MNLSDLLTKALSVTQALSNDPKRRAESDVPSSDPSSQPSDVPSDAPSDVVLVLELLHGGMASDERSELGLLDGGDLVWLEL